MPPITEKINNFTSDRVLKRRRALNQLFQLVSWAREEALNRDSYVDLGIAAGAVADAMAAERQALQ